MNNEQTTSSDQNRNNSDNSKHFSFCSKKKESAPGARGWWVPNFRKPNDEPFWDIKVQYREEERKKINYQK